MSLPVIDGEALREFLDKAEPFFDDPYLGELAMSLERRTRMARQAALPWGERWQLAPVSRRVAPDQRPKWEAQLEPVWGAIRSGSAPDVLAGLETLHARPAWVTDWATYWLHVLYPEGHPWWARWVYRPEHRTGALLLVTGEVAGLEAAGVTATYQMLCEVSQFLDAVLASTRRLSRIPDPYRPTVALAAVYAVYLFTMAAWKLTEEFTQVFPPLPVVMKSLLGINRWEASDLGGESQAD
jgi:hypothetical protein